MASKERRIIMYWSDKCSQQKPESCSWPHWIIFGLSTLTLSGVKQASAKSPSLMNESCSTLATPPPHRNLSACQPNHPPPPSSRPAVVGKCLFFLLNLTNNNTVNFISGGTPLNPLWAPSVQPKAGVVFSPVCLCTHLQPCAHEPTYS